MWPSKKWCKITKRKGQEKIFVQGNHLFLICFPNFFAFTLKVLIRRILLCSLFAANPPSSRICGIWTPHWINSSVLSHRDNEITDIYLQTIKTIIELECLCWDVNVFCWEIFCNKNKFYLMCVSFFAGQLMFLLASHLLFVNRVFRVLNAKQKHR